MPAVVQSPIRKRRVAGRPQLERETPIIAQAAARQVVEEAARWLGVQVPARYAAGLAHRARVTYAHGAAFRQKLRRAGDEGRDTLYAFMRHWLAARLQADRPEWFARLPQDYVWGGVELTGVSPCRVSHMTLPSPDDEPLSVEARSLWASF
jgi:hypothetical protein